MDFDLCNNQLVFSRLKLACQKQAIKNRVHRYFSLVVSMDMWCVMLLYIAKKHTDQNSVKHRDGRHALDLFINVRCVENWILIPIENVPSAVSASNHRSVSGEEKSVAS